MFEVRCVLNSNLIRCANKQSKEINWVCCVYVCVCVYKRDKNRKEHRIMIVLVLGGGGIWYNVTNYIILNIFFHESHKKMRGKKIHEER